MTLAQLCALVAFVVGIVFMVVEPGNLKSPINWFLIALDIVVLFTGIGALSGKVF